MSKKTGPKVLLIDIETSPMLAYIWKLGEQNVSLDQMHTDWNILSVCAKWLGKKDIYYFDLSKEKDKRSDRIILEKLSPLLNEADIILSQNGVSFDQKKINARLIINKLKPLNSTRSQDTMLIAKKYFGFTSNSLKYMTSVLCEKYKKLEHEAFPGLKLWIECLKDNKRAWEEMRRYNTHDVLALEEVFNRMCPFDKEGIDYNTYNEYDTLNYYCRCGSNQFKKNGFKYTSRGKYQRYECLKCKSEAKDYINLLSKEEKNRTKK